MIFLGVVITFCLAGNYAHAAVSTNQNRPTPQQSGAQQQGNPPTQQGGMNNGNQPQGISPTHGTSTPPDNTRNNSDGVVGKVTAISGNTLTLSGMKNEPGTKETSTFTTYTVDATHATITKGFGDNAQTLLLSDIAIDTMVQVHGTSSNGAIIASRIIQMDQQNDRPLSTSTPSDGQKQNGANELQGAQNNQGFFGKIFNPIKNFFMKMFGR